MIRRTYALVALGVGLALVAAAMLLKVLPGGFVVIGASLAFFGLLATGLSFVPRPEAAPDAPAPMPAFERIAGLFYRPAEVFRNLRAHPRWLTALLIITLCSFIYTTAFTRRITPERIADHTTQKVIETGWVKEADAAKMKEQQIEAAKDPVRVWGGVVGQFSFGFVLIAFLAGLFLLGVMALGGRINFWQALAIAAHAYLPVFVIQKLLSLLLLYLKSPDDIHPMLGAQGLVQDNLGVLFSPAEHPVLFAAASAFGVLSFYGLWLLATGLKNGGERVSKTTAWSMAIGIWVIGLLLAVSSAALFGSFMA
ncbi:MAG TPA: YIP1 family protein [Pyrinomonadaceae bacterium]